MDNRNFVRSRKRFKVYTWKYKKTITPIASFILLVNQIFGYNMNVIPDIIKEHGWLKLILTNLLICVLCSVSSMMLLKSITMIPHNNNFDQRIEYNTLVKYYLNDYNFKIISLLHYIGDFIAIISGIILFSKLIDILLIKLFGFTLLLQLYPNFNLYKINYGMLINSIYNSVGSSELAGSVLNGSAHLSGTLPSSDGKLVFGITLGYVICTLICINLTNSSLQETTKLQITTFFILLLSLLLLFVYIILGNFYSGNLFMKNGSFNFNKSNKNNNLNVNNNILSKLKNKFIKNDSKNNFKSNNRNTLSSTCNKAFNTGSKDSSKEHLLDPNDNKYGNGKLNRLNVIMSVILIFVDNYKLTSILPSWANEMKNNVNPTVIVWLTNVFGFAFYILLSVLFNSPNNYFNSQLVANSNITSNLLNIDNIVLLSSKFVGNRLLNKNLLINTSIILFILVTSIPDIIFGCISTRYNLLNLGYLNSNNSYFWGCVFPFLFTWLLLNESLFSDLLNNLGLMSALICDFLIPIVLYIISYNLYDKLYSTNLDDKKKDSLYKRVSLMVFKRLSDMNTNIHRLLFSPSKSRSTSNKGIEKQSSSLSIFSSLLSKYSILSSYKVSKKFTKSISSNFSNKFIKSISSNFSKSVSCNFARSISSKFTNSFSAKFLKSISLNFANSISNRFARSISSNFSNKFTKSISSNFSKSVSCNFRKTLSSNIRKTISNNFSANFAKKMSNLSNTQEVLLDSLHKDYIDGELTGGVLESRGSKYSDISNVTANTDGMNNFRNNNRNTLGSTSHTNGSKDTGKENGSVSTIDEVDDKNENGETVSNATVPNVDYMSFKIIKNSKELTKTQDDIFNMLNRPSLMVNTNKLNNNQLSTDSNYNRNALGSTGNTNGSKESGNNGKDSGNNNNSDTINSKDHEEEGNGDRNKERGMTRSDGKTHSSKSKHKNERSSNKIVVFPGVLFKYHLVIAKVMVAFFSSLIVLPPILYVYNLLQ